MFSSFRRFLLGDPLNPLNPNARKNISLIALFAWIGLGADALSSSCYGPEESFLALGVHAPLALYVMGIMVVTIFIISFGYNQVIELFPSGGGGYKVASRLLHPYVGLVSGAALLVDYVLTIAVSIASGTDAIFSFLPVTMVPYKLYVEAGAIFLLLVMNLRGLKEVIRILLPIFIGFVVVHFILIVYGIAAHSKGLPTVVPATIQETSQFAQAVGWISVLGLILHSYSLGAGTYTGLEAVSNNVQRLAEPRVKTGKRTMLYMAISLSFTAGGLILLYLLWDAHPVPGMTLNAVVFHSILGDSSFGHAALIITLALEAGLLFLAANSGFAAGPSVLANLAVDGWVPNRFRHLSNRLVIQNGLILYGFAAAGVLYITSGKVSVLVVLYSINVFITFSLALLGISVYWIKHRVTPAWKWHFLFSIFACLVTTSILCVTLFYKFAAGGWLTILLTSSLVVICIGVKSHYQYVANKLEAHSKILIQPLVEKHSPPFAIDPTQPTAIIFVNHIGVGIHTLLSIFRLFPNQFKNFIFLSAGAVDVESFSADSEIETMQTHVNQLLDYFVRFCQQNGYPAEGYALFGTDAVEELKKLIDTVDLKYPNAIYFTSQLVFRKENMVTRLLHNQTPLILQHYLHFRGRELMILPMRI
ncbi:MAG: APC family permease [Gammaproteobacteria bacterium]|nr:APC family permease [Gammaproteobacteria bacterium]